MAINCRWRSVVARSIVVGDQLSLDQLSLAISCRSINCRWRSIVAGDQLSFDQLSLDQLSLAINYRWRSIVVGDQLSQTPLLNQTTSTLYKQLYSMETAIGSTLRSRGRKPSPQLSIYSMENLLKSNYEL